MIAFKLFRILVLLLIFLGLAFYAQQQKLKSRAWTAPLQLVIYPINAAENNPAIDEYIHELDDSVFTPIDRFFAEQSQPYNLITHQPTITTLGPEISELPPEAPLPSAGYADIVWWSLKFRYWTFRHSVNDDGDVRRVHVFVLYHPYEKDKHLPHSLGLDKGLVALVHAFASIEQDQQNNVVITHEFLHTVGAGDKYAADNSPLFPVGYAAPEQTPLYPQTRAEIMAGRIAISETKAIMPESLEYCVIGPTTAVEINWMK